MRAFNRIASVLVLAVFAASCKPEDPEFAKKGPVSPEAVGTYRRISGEGINMGSTWVFESDWLKIYSSAGDLMFRYFVLEDASGTGSSGEIWHSLALKVEIFDGIFISDDVLCKLGYELMDIDQKDGMKVNLDTCVSWGNLLKGEPSGYISLVRLGGSGPTVSRKPTLVSPANGESVGTLKPELAWKFNSGGSGVKYTVEVFQGADATGTQVVSADVDHQGGKDDVQKYTVTQNLRPQLQYAWRVKGTVPGQPPTDFSDVSTFTIVALAPEPVSPTSGYTLDRKPVLTWRTVDWTTSYKLHVDNGEGGGYSTDVTIENPDSSSPTMQWRPESDLLDGQYWWKVAAVLEGAEYWCEAVYFYVMPIPVPESIDPCGATVSPSSQSLCWRVQVDLADLVDYEVSIDDSEDFATPVFDRTLSRNELTQESNPAMTKQFCFPMSQSGVSFPPGIYYWRVRAKYGEETGQFSTSCSLTVGIPALISPSDGASIENGTPTFQWFPVDGAQHYQLVISRLEEFSGEIVLSESPPTNQFTPASPLPFGNFHWRVRAVVAETPGPWSSAWSFFRVQSLEGWMIDMKIAHAADGTQFLVYQENGGTRKFYLLRRGADNSFSSPREIPDPFGCAPDAGHVLHSAEVAPDGTLVLYKCSQCNFNPATCGMIKYSPPDYSTQTSEIVNVRMDPKFTLGPDGEAYILSSEEKLYTNKGIKNTSGAYVTQPGTFGEILVHNDISVVYDLAVDPAGISHMFFFGVENVENKVIYRQLKPDDNGDIIYDEAGQTYPGLEPEVLIDIQEAQPNTPAPRMAVLSSDDIRILTIENGDLFLVKGSQTGGFDTANKQILASDIHEIKGFKADGNGIIHAVVSYEGENQGWRYLRCFKIRSDGNVSIETFVPSDARAQLIGFDLSDDGARRTAVIGIEGMQYRILVEF